MGMRLPLNISQNFEMCSDVRIEVVTLTVMWPFILGSLPYLGPAYDMALEKIEISYPHLHVKQTLCTDKRYRDCEAVTADSVNQIAAYIYGTSLDTHQDACAVTALIFPGCNEIIEVMKFATGLDILMLTSVGSATPLRNKAISPTWVTFSSNSFTTLVRMYVNLADKLGWKSLAVLIDEGSNPFFASFGATLKLALRKENQFQVYTEKFNSGTGVNYRAVLLRLNSVSRIFLYLGEPATFRQLLLTGAKLNFTQGEHVYVIMTPFRFNTRPGYFTWKAGDEDDTVAQEAYRSVLMIEPDNGTLKSINGFSFEMRQRSRTNYNFTYPEYDVVSPHPTSTYAAFLALAEVVEELRVSGKQHVWSSGRSLAQRFLNRTFVTDISEIHIDLVGERIPTLHVNQLDWSTSCIRTIFAQNASTLQLKTVEQTQWLITWPPSSQPKCGFRGDDPVCTGNNNGFIIIVASATGVTILFIIFLSVGTGTVLTRRAKYLHFVTSPDWIIEPQYLKQLGEKGPKAMVFLKEQRTVWMSKIGPRQSTSFPMSPQLSLSKPMLRLLEMLLKLDHRNINRFLGVSLMEHFWYSICDYCSRGSLCDLMSKTTLDFDLQTALLFDFLQGLQAVHRSSIKCHGNLTSYCCLIDKYFTLKIGEVGFSHMKRLIVKGSNHKNENEDRRLKTVDSSDDLQAVAVIMYQIIVLEDTPKSADDIRAVLSQCTENFPSVFAKVRPDLLLCTDQIPKNRPDLDYLTKSFGNALRPDIGKQGNLVERMMRRFETYISDLDQQVALRTQALLNEGKRCDALLREMFPSLIVEQLRKGLLADAEMFQSTTVMFTEIGGFNSILQSTKPRTAMMFLNDVYSAFDTVLDRHDVFKVETIKDSYLVVSGLPKRNGYFHAKEICALAASLFKAYSAFQPLFDGTSLRAGIHSGSCAAGVVGHKTPRYCLFGDTVNTASRMLTHGADDRVHLSQSTAELLELFPDIKLERRGETEIKGKGTITTFWLLLT